MLRIEHLTKAYGEKKAVDDLNLHIAPREIYGFIGHNGAGKTTTLKSVAGILQFDAGHVLVNIRIVRDVCQHLLAAQGILLDRASPDGDLAGVKLLDAHDGFQGGGFSGTVVADEAVDLTGRNVQVQVVHGLLLTVGF